MFYSFNNKIRSKLLQKRLRKKKKKSLELLPKIFVLRKRIKYERKYRQIFRSPILGKIFITQVEKIVLFKHEH